MKILGVSALYHDSAASLVDNGHVIAAAQEERFTRKKGDARIPFNSIQFCLESCSVDASELDAVVYYENPLLTVDRAITTTGQFSKGEITETQLKRLNSVLGNKLWIGDQLRQHMTRLGRDDKLLCIDHHLSHAASAFYPSPFRDSAILTIDGVGEWGTLTIGFGEDRDISILKQMDYPDSLGLLYSAFTAYCGFKVNSGEYKLMGLAPYGTPLHTDKIKQNIVDVFDDGSISLNLDYFSFTASDQTYNDKFEALFGEPGRMAETELTQHYMDVAASIQKVTEEIVLKLAVTAKELTGSRNLCLAGGVALNCVANGYLQRENIFDGIWIQPAAGDAGGAMGAALYVAYQKYEVERVVDDHDAQKGSFLGPGYSGTHIQQVLEEHGCAYTECSNREERDQILSELLDDGAVVGLFQGKMEFGPRALGHRSILGDPRRTEMQSRMNIKIKFRESFRPFAPSVLAEKSADYFSFAGESPYMLLVDHVRPELRSDFDLSAQRETSGLRDIANAPRSTIPAITHVDFSARLHTVDKRRNPEFYGVIKAFYDRTDCPVLINTSFNVRGEPIVCSPEDAIQCFLATDIDVLVLEDFLLRKEDQPLGLIKAAEEITYELD